MLLLIENIPALSCNPATAAMLALPACVPVLLCCPSCCSELRVVGGGSQNKLWRRVLADAFQLPLRFPSEPEAAALGAALQVGCRCPCQLVVLQCAAGVWQCHAAHFALGGAMLHVCCPVPAHVWPLLLHAVCRQLRCTAASLWQLMWRGSRPPWVRCSRRVAGSARGLGGVNADTRNPRPACSASCMLYEQPPNPVPELSHPSRPLPAAEPEVVQPQHEAAAAYAAAFERHQHWGACIFGGGSCEL